jgi:predicted Zn-dependent protease
MRLLATLLLFASVHSAWAGCFRPPEPTVPPGQAAPAPAVAPQTAAPPAAPSPAVAPPEEAIDVMIVPDVGVGMSADALAADLSNLFKLRIRASLAMPFAPPEPAGQLNAPDQIALASQAIGRLKASNGDPLIMIVTYADINDPAMGTRYLFAFHDIKQRVSVISLARLSGDLQPKADGSFAPEDDAKFQMRAMKFFVRTIAEQCLMLPRSNDLGSILYAPIMSLDDLDPIGTRLP